MTDSILSVKRSFCPHIFVSGSIDVSEYLTIMCFLLFLRMLCQLSDHGVSLVKQVPIDEEETVCKVCEAIVTIII